MGLGGLLIVSFVIRYQWLEGWEGQENNVEEEGEHTMRQNTHTSFQPNRIPSSHIPSFKSIPHRPPLDSSSSYGKNTPSAYKERKSKMRSSPQLGGFDSE